MFPAIRLSGSLLAVPIMNIDPGEKIFFREIQYYRQRWILLLLMAAAGIAWYNLLNFILFRDFLSNSPIQIWISVVLWVIFGILAPAFLFFTRLKTEVKSDGLHINFRPFSSLSINYSDIKSAKPVDEIPPEKHGFLDIHTGCGTPPVFLITGHKAVHIILQNGDNIMLSSNDPETLVTAINRQLHQ